MATLKIDGGSEHPVDIITKNRAVLSFLAQVFIQQNGDITLNADDQWGLSCILEAVDNSLSDAIRAL